MAGLTPKQRAHLRSLARTLRPTLQVGKEGVTPAMIERVRVALDRDELLKLRVLDASPQGADVAAEALAAGIAGAEVVQVVGRTLVIYRLHPERPQVRLLE